MNIVDQNQKLNEMCAWYQKLPGSMLFDLEHQSLQPFWPDFSADYVLQIAGPFPPNFLAYAPAQCKLHTHPGLFHSPSFVCQIQADIQALPLANDSMDLVILPHLLEFIASPLALLGDCERLTKDLGYLVIFAFSPWSLWGIWKLFQSSKKVPWFGSFYSLGKIKRWLLQTHYQILHYHHLCFHWPTQSQTWARYRWTFEMIGQICCSDLGSIYMIVAQKQKPCVTSIKPHWLAQKKLGLREAMALGS